MKMYNVQGKRNDGWRKFLRWASGAKQSIRGFVGPVAQGLQWWETVAKC